MDWQSVLQMGFSFFVAVYLLVTVNSTMEKLRDAINDLSHQVRELRSFLGGKKTVAGEANE
jgi:hypothetical protein